VIGGFTALPIIPRFQSFDVGHGGEWVIEGVFLSHFGRFVKATLACDSKLRELKVEGMGFVTVARYPIQYMDRLSSQPHQVQPA
jgi:hypothetical protein